MPHWGPTSAHFGWKQKVVSEHVLMSLSGAVLVNPVGGSHALKRKWAWMLLDRPRSAVTRQGAAVRMWVEELASLRDNSEKEAETTSSSFSSSPPPPPPPPPHPLSTLHSNSGRLLLFPSPTSSHFTLSHMVFLCSLTTYYFPAYVSLRDSFLF